MIQKIKDFIMAGTLVVVVFLVVTTAFLSFVYIAAFGIGLILITSKGLIGKELTIAGLVLFFFFFIGGTTYYLEKSQT